VARHTRLMISPAHNAVRQSHCSGNACFRTRSVNVNVGVGFIPTRPLLTLFLSPSPSRSLVLLLPLSPPSSTSSLPVSLLPPADLPPSITMLPTQSRTTAITIHR